MSEAAQTDILIVGAGLAGLFLALQLHPRACVVLSPAPLGEMAASAWAQGGLAAALGPKDSPQSHADDTIAAGAGLVDPVVARLIAEEGPARVRDLIRLGVAFDRTPDGDLALSLEAAHTHPRVARVAGDLAGKAIMTALVRAARASPHITLIEGVRATALLSTGNARIVGVRTRDGASRSSAIGARHVVLATGGSGGLFRVTTNPKEARGAALAFAFTAGAAIADPEFVQFHPTAIDIGKDPAPLATEALRGEGAVLRDGSGRAFMADYHRLADLAPRDIVARAIASEIAAGRGAFLDCRSTIGPSFPHHFPTVFGACMSAGIDPRSAAIPVAPAAHYHMGGIVTDLWGSASIDGLSACGECASTGAHGANRLASNSLLEAVVFAQRIATRLREDALPEPAQGDSAQPPLLPASDLAELRLRMTRDCGVVRNKEGLSDLVEWIALARRRIGDASALVAAELIAVAAHARTESRGGHYRSDYPNAATTAQRSFLARARNGATLIDTPKETHDILSTA